MVGKYNTAGGSLLINLDISRSMGGTHYAFYGTLRRDMEYFDVFRRNIKYRKTVEVNGYRMYSLGDYPYVVKSPRHAIICDLCEIKNGEISDEIENMEIESGYIRERIRVADEYFFIFIFKDYIPGTPEIVPGDWVKFRMK